ncbi:hypothetical protein BS47DRAFT_1062391 [Hydnum rufescens UP504]|uniref:Translation initiation factor IF2/IF5 domain-containing protein n=1 Tax=Hydnum rufescens UP504 TaxID=1448309 RepID=A0A9P6DRR5_9AGAM|nr:hypothetical protein BS47DRAFT_1062391 [Hydnum rufescens UP504]
MCRRPGWRYVKPDILHHLSRQVPRQVMADIESAPAEEPLFDPSLKKKKKKKAVAFDEELLGVDSNANAPTPSLGNDGPAEAGQATSDSLLADFSDLKKKKKKKATFDLDDVEETKPAPPPEEDDAPVDDLDNLDDEDLGDDPFAVASGPGLEGNGEVEPWHGTDRDYTYAELLNRIVRTLHSQNPDLSSATRKRYTIVPPSVHREGNKKTIFANVADICKRMHRQPEHVIQFLFAELGTTGSVDGEKRLVIKGRFQPKQLENVLRRYIVEYVTCKTCKSPDTILTKENRIYFMTCESCGSRRSVSAIKTGFQAQIGKRKKKV